MYFVVMCEYDEEKNGLLPGLLLLTYYVLFFHVVNSTYLLSTTTILLHLTGNLSYKLIVLPLSSLLIDCV